MFKYYTKIKHFHAQGQRVKKKDKEVIYLYEYIYINIMICIFNNLFNILILYKDSVCKQIRYECNNYKRQNFLYFSNSIKKKIMRPDPLKMIPTVFYN